MMPLADFCGGQIYKAGCFDQFIQITSSFILGGFAPVYWTSLGFIFLGILYIWLIPESVTRRTQPKEVNDEEEEGEEEDSNNNIPDDDAKLIPIKKKKSIWTFIVDTSNLFLDTIKYIFR